MPGLLLCCCVCDLVAASLQGNNVRRQLGDPAAGERLTEENNRLTKTWAADREKKA